MAKRVELGADEVLVYKGLEINRAVLNAIVDTNKRLLWAFVRKGADLRAVPYTEAEVIWMAESDVLRAQDVEI